MKPHDSQIALVTGAGSGIGRAISEKLADLGAHVCLIDRDASGLAETARLIAQAGGQSTPFILDLSHTESILSTLAEIDRQVGQPDIVVNNAGIAATLPILDAPIDHWQLSLAINLTAPFLIMQHTARAMKSKGWGRIVNIASISGVRAGTGRVAYGTTKAGLLQLTRQFAVESGEWGVTVNAIAPGPIETPMVKSVHGGDTRESYYRLLPMRRYGETGEIAHAVGFLVSREASYITGETLAVDGGFLASGLLVRDLF